MTTDYKMGDAHYHQYNCYLKRLNDDDAEGKLFETFKTHPDVMYMLEHVTRTQAELYMATIAQRHGTIPLSLWDQVVQNDAVGGARKESFSSMPFLQRQEPDQVSPSTIRYLMFAMDAMKLVRDRGHPVRIVEIGGGYGGLCKVFLDVCQAYQVPVESYTILDTEQPSRFQAKYLSVVDHQTDVEINCCTFDQVKERSRFDLCISTFCYSELDPPFRARYRTQLLPFCNRGYMAWNNLQTDVQTVRAETGKPQAYVRIDDVLDRAQTVMW